MLAGTVVTSSDVLLQVFDAAAKKARDNARSKTEATVREIQAWMQKAESLGITSFDWISLMKYSFLT